MVKNFFETASSLIFVLLLAPAVMAASVELEVSTGQHPPDRISSCPDTVLGDIEVMVTNLGGQTDTVMLSLDWPSDLGFIKPHQTLASGEAAVISPFWITLPYNLEPGIYHAKVTAKSSVSGDTITKDIEIEVMRCHSVGIVIDDDYGRSCQETQEPVVYDIEIMNQGKWSESFGLSASVDWAEFSQDSVTVESEESYIVSLVLNPPEGISPGKHTVFVTARSKESYASATASVEMDVVECLDFTAELEPESLDACLGDSRDYELTITNTGEEEDEYLIDTPDWVYPDRTRTELDAGKSATIVLIAVPEEKGTQGFEVTVTSERDLPASPKTISGVINVEECRGVAVIVSPSESAVCRGEDTELSISIKNTGGIEETFLITSTFGELSRDSVTLDAGESETTTLDVDTSDLPEGTVVIEVTASDGEITDTATAEVEVEECYTAEFSLQPDAVTVCPGAEIPYTIKVRNTGKETDNYTVEFAEESVSVSLEPGESHVINYDYEIPYIEEGRYLFTAELSSEGGISRLASSDINLKSSEACYGVELVDGPGAVDVGKATTIDITIKNTGEQADRFTVTMDGPDWAYIEPAEVHLGSGEEDSVYVYLSPGFGTLEGTYSVAIRAESDHASDELEIAVTVPENITEAPEEPPEEEVPPENVSINVTHPGEEEPPITGEVIEERPFWKTAAVAVIALIIVLILILRFVLLFKK
jgi:uncharacterized membrane protein